MNIEDIKGIGTKTLSNLKKIGIINQDFYICF